jgi:RNA polymerase sigma-70 factor, ECF subfamily
VVFATASSEVQCAPWGHNPEAEIVDLVSTNWPIILKICQSHLRSTADAEDATQETFARFLAADHSRIRNPEAWLISVALRICGNTHRLRYKRAESELVPESHVSELTSIALNDVELEVWFEQLTARLSPLDRQLLSWLYFENLRHDEVASRLGISNGSLRVAAYRARQRARSALLRLDDPFGWQL